MSKSAWGVSYFSQATRSLLLRQGGSFSALVARHSAFHLHHSRVSVFRSRRHGVFSIELAYGYPFQSVFYVVLGIAFLSPRLG
jgi:hypothetical protein